MLRKGRGKGEITTSVMIVAKNARARLSSNYIPPRHGGHLEKRARAAILESDVFLPVFVFKFVPPPIGIRILRISVVFNKFDDLS